MFISLMQSEHCEFVGLGRTEQEAREAVAAEFDKRLKSTGDTNRERSLYHIGSVEEPEEVEESRLKFGSDLEWWAKQLDDWYCISVHELAPGQAYHH